MPFTQPLKPSVSAARMHTKPSCSIQAPTVQTRVGLENQVGRKRPIPSLLGRLPGWWRVMSTSGQATNSAQLIPGQTTHGTCLGGTLCATALHLGYGKWNAYGHLPKSTWLGWFCGCQAHPAMLTQTTSTWEITHLVRQGIVFAPKRNIWIQGTDLGLLLYDTCIHLLREKKDDGHQFSELTSHAFHPVNWDLQREQKATGFQDYCLCCAWIIDTASIPGAQGRGKDAFLYQQTC